MFAYEEFREVRKQGGTVFELADTLTKYASKKNGCDFVINYRKEDFDKIRPEMDLE